MLERRSLPLIPTAQLDRTNLYSRGAATAGNAGERVSRQSIRNSVRTLVMGDQIGANNQTGDDTIERLAQTVAHLALQLTIVQLQLRALGAAAAESGMLDSDRVEQATANVARMHAGRYLQEN